MAEYWVEFSVLHSRSCWPVIPCTTVCQCQSQTSSPSPATLDPLGNHKFVFKVYDSVSILQISSCVSFFFNIPRISDITWCVSFTVWLTSLSMRLSSLGPSMLLQMALFHSFYGSVVFRCVDVPHLLYSLLCWWTIRLLPCLDYCK